NVKLMRQKCAIVVALGACSCYGSVAGLANLYDKEELVRRKFTETESITDKKPKEPTINVPGFEEYIVNVDEIVNVDVFIPGCPPTTNNIVAAISFLLTLVGEGPATLDKNGCVCSTCNLKDKGCFLDENILCYGAITAAGCNLMCPNNGDICFGCFRSTDKPGEKVIQLREILFSTVALEPEHAASLQHFLDLYTGVSNITNFYFRGDLLQKLAYEPKSFEIKDVQIGEDIKFALNVAPTGIEIIDDIIGISLYLLRDDPNFKFSSKSVCSHCDRDVTDKLPVHLKRDYEGLPTMDTCFLEQGYMCIGPVTQAGCGTICPNKANAPCLGCYGAVTGVVDPGVKFISTLGSLCKDKDPDEVMELIKDPAGLFNRFTLAASTLGHKYHDKMDDE
ncbi:MAG: hypothetical protein KAW66_08565, partial [Candidatus Lokiarchaeota archaeon]|nr:hypothetical protein [Candidatus Lokiarchaeota archaeon]